MTETEPKSTEAQEAEVRALITKYVHRTVGRDKPEFDELLQLMSKQPQWTQKLDTIQQFRITRSRSNKALKLQVKLAKGPWLTVSWRKSVNKPRKEPNPLQSAFRNSIRRQISIWRNAHVGRKECAQCQSTHMLQVDHKDPLFIDITQRFLEKYKQEEVPTSFDYCGTRGKKFKPCDKKFAAQWRKHHQSLATYQWLCRKCNTSKAKSNK